MIVFDASWIVALRDPADIHHRAAAAAAQTFGDERRLISDVTLAECLVSAARLGSVEPAAEAVRLAFEIVHADADAPLRWATVRSETGLRLPDAIVLDTATRLGARAVATFDARLGDRARDRELELV